jgi:hypothetical protein
MKTLLYERKRRSSVSSFTTSARCLCTSSIDSFRPRSRTRGRRISEDIGRHRSALTWSTFFAGLCLRSRSALNSHCRCTGRARDGRRRACPRCAKGCPRSLPGSLAALKEEVNQEGIVTCGCAAMGTRTKRKKAYHSRPGARRNLMARPMLERLDSQQTHKR